MFCVKTLTQCIFCFINKRPDAEQSYGFALGFCPLQISSETLGLRKKKKKILLCGFFVLFILLLNKQKFTHVETEEGSK